MTGKRWVTVPLTLVTDEQHGGRWTSLRTGHREWLWKNPDPAVIRSRGTVEPSAPFVDAGGVEECVPTVRGMPDHGDAWCRVWVESPASVELPGVGRLTRTVTSGDDGIELTYALLGAPGTPFLHAVHALLEVGPAARIEVTVVTSMLVLDPEPHLLPWPSGLDRLGPDDGTATCALLAGCREVLVVDGDQALRFTWTAPGHDELCSLLVWRNLRGWPTDAPYRSIGIEPMVGRAADLGNADPADVARIGLDGSHVWNLRVAALEKLEFQPREATGRHPAA